MSLTSCLRAAGKSLSRENRAAVVSLSRKHRAGGLEPDAAAMRALDDVIAQHETQLKTMMAAAVAPAAASAPTVHPAEPIEAANQETMDLRKLGRKTEQPGDVMLNSDPPRFVTLEQAVAAARAQMEPSAWSMPFQYNRVLDIAPRDWDRMVQAMTTPAAAPQGAQDLLGAAPNATLQAAANLQAERSDKEQRQRDAAPDASEFRLSGSDRGADEAAAAGQAELIPSTTPAATTPAAEAEKPATEKPAAAPRDAKTIASEIASGRPFDEFNDVRQDVMEAIRKEAGDQALTDTQRGFLRDELSEAIHAGQYQGTRAWAEKLPVPVLESQISRETAMRAHEGTSHSPQERGAGDIRSYLRTMADAWRGIAAKYAAADEATQERVREEFKALRDGYAQRMNAYLAAHGRVMSSMIAGPANFPVASNRKKSDTADRRAQEASEFLVKGKKRLARAFAGPVDRSLQTELSSIEQRIKAAEALQENMRVVNAALRKGDDAALKAIGYDDGQIAELKKPDFAGRTGFPDYRLKNNNAEIRRLKDRQADVQKRIDGAEAATEAEDAAPAEAATGPRIEQDAANNRVRIIFDGKPDEATRTALKKAGFRWSPTNGAWQRQLTQPGVAEAKRIVESMRPDVAFARTSTADAARQSMSTEQLQDFADAIAMKWANAPEIVVVDSMDDPRVPEEARDDNATQQSQGASGAAAGFFYDPERTVYLVASEISSPLEAATVLAHESLGHFGLRGTFGDKLVPILQQIVSMRRKEVLAKAEAYGLDPKKNEDLLQAAEEVLATMAQSTPKLAFVQRAIAAVRSFLRDTLGLELELTDDEIIRSFILPAREWVVSGRAAATQGVGVRFSRGTKESIPDKPGAAMSLAQVREKMAELKGMAVPKVQAIVDDLTKDWKGGIEVRVVATSRDLPGADIGSGRTAARGMYANGVGYIVAAMHKDRAAIGRTLAHEVIQHHGVLATLGADGRLQLMKQIQAAAKAGNAEVLAARDYVRRVYRNPDGTPRLREGGATEADEMAAHLIEQSVDENGNMKPRLQWLKWVWSKVAAFLRSVGLPVTFTLPELHGIWVEARRGLERGTMPDLAPNAQPQTETPEFGRLGDLLGSARAARDMFASSDKAVVDGLQRNAEGISDFLERHATGAHGGGKVRVPASVLTHVLQVADNQQVLRAVVRSIPVDVMDFFRRKQLAPEQVLSDEAMLKNVFAVDGATDVSLAIDKSGAVTLLRAVARTAAEVASNLTRGPLKNDAARGAREGDSVSRTHAASVTETEAFSKWFGNSKVVDSDGKPLVVYHGTKADFDVFDTEAEPNTYKDDRGKFFFTDSAEGASGYAEDSGSGANVMPVYLSLRNPRIETTDLDPSDWWDRHGSKNFWQWDVLDAGHDGLIVRSDDGSSLFVASSPEQIKSATGNRGTFDAGSSNILYALSDDQIVGNTGRYTPEQERHMRNVGWITDPVPLQERMREQWKTFSKGLTQGLVDQFAPIKELSREAYGLLRLSKGASGAFEVMLHGGQLKLTDGVYDFDDTKRGGVLDRLLKPLHGEHHDFLRWVAANRAEQLLTEDRERLFTADDIRVLKTLSDGELGFDFPLQHGPRAGQTTRSRAEAYADSLATFNEFNKNTLDMAQQSGLIDGESRALWEKQFYVPFYRVADEGDGGIRGMNIKSGVVRQQAFKQLKGGSEKLNADLLENTLMNWAHLLDASAKNRAARATLDVLSNLGSAIEAPEGDARGMAKSMGKRNNVVWMMDAGRQRFFVIDDPHLLAAVSALEFAGFRSPVMKAMSTFKNALTVGVTASPFFKARNLIRDSVQAIGTAPLSYNVAGNLKQGWAATRPGSDSYFQLLAGGGTIHFGSMMEGSEARRVQSLVNAGVDRATILDTGERVKAFYGKTLEPLITAYNALGDRGEAINRAALYQQLRAQGVNHAEASLSARDLMDFSMQGSFTTVRFLTQVVPFMNARMQGLYKLGRAAQEDPARFSAVIGATALMSIALLAAYSDDDDWKKREDWDRNNYWWFKAGGIAYRIPKPFEIGAIATLAERSWEAMFDAEMTGERFRSQIVALMGDQLSMNPLPQIVKPVLDVYSNKDSFTGRPIETMGMEKLQPQFRFRSDTTMAARGASTALNAVMASQGPSPVQIDHLVRGYFGWLGSMIVTAGDAIARPATGQPDLPQPDYWRVLTGAMVSNLQDAPSRYVSATYKQAKELEEVYGTWRHLIREGKVAEAQAFREEYSQELVRYRHVEAVKRAETRLNQLRHRVEEGSGTPEDKRARIRELNQQADQMARRLAPS